jgi:hypothetical protein
MLFINLQNKLFEPRFNLSFVQGIIGSSYHYRIGIYYKQKFSKMEKKLYLSSLFTRRFIHSII